MSEIADMVRHWLRMRANGYLGQSYGNTLKDLLQKPIGMAQGDQLLRKLMIDVPILTQLPSGSVNVYAEDLSKEHKRIIVDLAGTQVTIDSMGNVN
ncbi:hypothetical protein BJP27_23970 (plasmid) [Pseudomonas oryzihabitans]|nr:hypothetical protein BJP27_23970 [Pseudomonas psychrotolerans]